MKVAFVTDVGNIDDHSFNQYTYEGVTRFGKASGCEVTYYKPSEDTDQSREDAINQAIVRIRNGKYGVCAMCGKKIPEERLRAIPYALLCMPCKRKSER